MKLTDKTDYSLRVLIYLLNQEDPNERCKIQDIASFFGISKNHLKVVVNRLSEMGIVFSFTGPTGGIILNSHSLEMKLGVLVRSLEDVGLVECLSTSSFSVPSQSSCVIDGKCHLKGILHKATKAFLEELDQYQISDLSNKNKKSGVLPFPV